MAYSIVRRFVGGIEFSPLPTPHRPRCHSGDALSCRDQVICVMEKTIMINMTTVAIQSVRLIQVAGRIAVGK